MWRKLFKPRYHRQFARAHELGLETWYHCCGNLTEITEDFHEIGVDVLNIAQPNVVDVAAVCRAAAGQAVFSHPDQLPDGVDLGHARGNLRRGAAAVRPAGDGRGGFIGYVEEYGCMGMSAENYRACAEAFRRLRPPR